MCECGLCVGHKNVIIADQIFQMQPQFLYMVFVPTLNPTFCLYLYIERQ